MALGSSNHPYQRHQQLLSVTRGIYQQQQRPIAPTPISPFAPKPAIACYSAGTTLDSNNPSVVRRNARERNRVKQVNNGFSNLRQHLPPAIVADLSNGRRGIGPGAHKKLSKVDTLRMALEYIRRLQRVIEEADGKRGTPNSCADRTRLAGAEQFYAISYAGSFGQQRQQQPHTSLTSPATSIGSTSSEYSSDASLFYNSPTHDAGADCGPVQLKFGQTFDAHAHTQHCPDEDDILDYITLWQEEM